MHLSENSTEYGAYISINKSDLLEIICKHVHHVSFDKGVIFEPLFEKNYSRIFSADYGKEFDKKIVKWPS